MTISDLYSELMKQSFNDSVGFNYTPYAIMLYLKEKRYILLKDPLDNLCRYIYRFYSDNLALAKENSSVLISNINHYYSSDIKDYLLEQLSTWMKNGNNVLLTDGTFLILNPELSSLSEKDKIMLDKIIDLLSVRNFKRIISYSPNIEKEICNINHSMCSYETYKIQIAKTKFVRRAFEDMNYCACCEEINPKSLQAIHLNLLKELDDPLNSIVLCDEHAKMYYAGKFRFSKTGKIIIYENSYSLDKRMHLNSKLVKMKNKFLVDICPG